MVAEHGELQGVEAVIDKDRASALLATELGVDLFVISTDTDHVYLNYKKSGQTALKRVTAAEMRIHLADGHFPPGNMGPKVESVLHFLEGGGEEAVITSFEHLCEAVEGKAGTHIVRDGRKAGQEMEQDLVLTAVLK